MPKLKEIWLPQLSLVLLRFQIPDDVEQFGGRVVHTAVTALWGARKRNRQHNHEDNLKS